MPHIWYHADRHEQRKRVTNIASILVKDLGLALAPNMCPDQSQAFKEVNNSQAFQEEENLYISHFFLNKPLPGELTA